MTNMVDAVGTTKYTYTVGDQLLTEDGPFASNNVTNTYLNRLRTALSLGQPTGVWTNGFGYDAARRLTNVISQAGSFTNVYAAGVPGAAGFSSRLVQQLLVANTSAITNNFDSVGRLMGTYWRTSRGTLTNKQEYAYNLAGQRTSETRMDASTVGYTYDGIGQLKVADSSVDAEDRGYTYGAAWNLNYRTNNGVLTSFTVNSLNELTTAPDGGYSYSPNGNLVQSGIDGDHNPSWEYTYDDENRLVQLTQWGVPDGSEDIIPVAYSDFVYDGLGRLRQRTDHTWIVGSGSWSEVGQTRYSYDGWRVIQERNSSNTPTVGYTRGNDLSGSLEGAGGMGGLLARSSGYSGGNWSTHNYYQADGNGNVTFMLNSSQSMVAKYRYDPYGNAISSSGTLASANTYRFSSKEIHPTSGLYYYGYRWYSPGLQRWTSRDPTDEDRGINLYCFNYNSPAAYLDPSGDNPAAVVGGTIGTVVEPGGGTLLGTLVGGVISAIAGYCVAELIEETHEQWCARKWEKARKDCAEELAKPYPSRRFTGGYKDIENCARGHVPEECGGNPVDWGDRPPKGPGGGKRW